MNIVQTRFSILLLAALGGCGSSGDLTDIDVPLPEQHPRALADQYRAAAERRRSQPKTDPAEPRFDVPLATSQNSALEAIIERLRANLATQAADGAPEITHMAAQTGAPDHLLLANLWFTAQLTDDTADWRYELTFLWKHDRWVAFGGTAQQGLDQGRELEPAFVEVLIAE